MLKRRSTNPAIVHWSKDFVEHLRTVHFALVAVSVGLILLLSRSSSPALGQIRQVIELRKQWPPEWLSYIPEAETVHLKNFLHLPQKPLGDAWRISWRQSEQVCVTVDEKRPGNGSVVCLKFPLHNCVGGGEEFFEFPTTLAEFRGWWAQLQNGYSVYLPEGIYADGLAQSSYSGRRDHVVHMMSPADQRHRENLPQAMSYSLELFATANDSFAFAAFDPKREVTYYLVPFDMKLVKVDQDAIISGGRTLGWNWTKGPFERSFAALAQETNGLEEEDLVEVEKVVTERLANRSEAFEAFGMKFPIAQVTLWGTVVLLGVQLYFFLYLKQLSGKLGPDDPGWDIPWISMDQSFLAQAIFFTTVIVLPVIAMLLLGGRGSLQLTAGYRVSDSWHLQVKIKDWEWTVRLGVAAYLLASIAALTLGIASWTFRPRLSPKTEQHCPAQLFE
jgi:hypothetical protein